MCVWGGGTDLQQSSAVFGRVPTLIHHCFHTYMYAGRGPGEEPGADGLHHGWVRGCVSVMSHGPHSAPPPPPSSHLAPSSPVLFPKFHTSTLSSPSVGSPSAPVLEFLEEWTTEPLEDISPRCERVWGGGGGNRDGNVWMDRNLCSKTPRLR